MSVFFRRLRYLLQRRRFDQELANDMAFHREMAAREGGSAPFGNELRLREEARDAWGWTWVERLAQDLRYAAWQLRKSPGFTVAAILMLGIGIGANTAIFSLVDTVMLKLLPVKAPKQLYFVGHTPQHVSMTWNYPDYRAMRDHNTVFSGLAAYSLGLKPLGIDGVGAGAYTTELSSGIFVSGNYFNVLGVSAVLGRVFNAEDDRAPGASPYVILSYSYWRSHFGGDVRAIGHKLHVNGYPLTVIGVAPRGFAGADVAFKPDLFIPIMMQSEVMHVPFKSWNDRHTWWIAAIGRLRPGASIGEAEGQLFAICKGQEAAERRSLANPNWANTAEQVVLRPADRGFSYLANEIKQPLLILFVVVAVVLLIACLNIANLMLLRGAARQREIAVRLALGASRWRVISQLVAESMSIAILGGLSGVLLSLLGIRVLLRFVPESGSRLITGIDATLDWRVLAFTGSMCVLTGLLFGLAPAWQSTRPDLVAALKEEIPGSGGVSRFSFRKALVIAQVALSLPLLIGAGLFARTLGNLRGRDVGFVADQVFIASVDPGSFGYKGQRVRDFYDRLCTKTAALPGVRAVSLALVTPLTGSSWDGNITVEGFTPRAGERNHVWFNAVGPRYFEALGTPLLLGREFTEQDNPSSTIELPDHITPGMQLADPPGMHAAIVNEAFERHFFGGRSPIGMHVATEAPFRSVYEIVGVVKDARYSSVRNAAEPMIFLPVWRRFAGQRELVIRTSESAAQLSGLLRHEIHDLDPAIPLLNLRTMEHDLNESILVERLVATLSGFFAVLALLLSGIGLYGVVAYTVTRRTREIGIRIAVGASRGSVVWLVFREVILMVFAGGIIGIVIAFAATRVIASILYGVSATDPLIVCAGVALLMFAAILASFLPARRAAGIDPIAALRYE